MDRKIRTLIVDDSAFYRGILSDLLQQTGMVEVQAQAASGDQALKKIADNQPDMITLDVEMPGMDGLEVLSRVRSEYPGIYVVMISSATQSSAEVTISALEKGALDFIEKPTGSDLLSNEKKLYRQLQRVVNIVDTKLILRRTASPLPVSCDRTPTVVPQSFDVIAIGVSTGGPVALPVALAPLPADFKCPIVIVQHMPAMFVRVLADSLSRKINLPVEVPDTGTPLKPGTIYLAPGGRQARVVRRTDNSVPVFEMTDDPPENFCRPSVDYMYRSLATVFGGNVLGVVMTGMGKDGTEGARILKSRGATIIGQDEASSTVFGMAHEAFKAGTISALLPLGELGDHILKMTKR